MKKNSNWTLVALSVCLALVLAVTGGCAKKKKDQQIALEDFSSGGTDRMTGQTEGEEQPNLELEELLFSKATGLQPVYFDYDSYALRPDALATLKLNADKILKVPNVVIQIEGHCDERGTQEYNFALGERRALAVRRVSFL